MATTNFELDLKLQEDQIREFKPDIVIGSSYGGAIAVTMLQKGTWTGPTLLLAQAFTIIHKSEPDKWWLPENVPIILIHGTQDDIVPIEGSQMLAMTGTKNLVQLIEVDDNHRLEQSLAMLENAVNKLLN